MNNNHPDTEKIVILGSGPAGLTAALYTARADLSPLVYTGSALGGQVSLTYQIENYPGFPDGISGQDLTASFVTQAERFGARIEYDSVTKVDFSQRPFLIQTEESQVYAEAVILATGATPRFIQVPGEKEYTGLGVSYCATCDGHFFRGKQTVVVGGGDSAVEEALFLTRFADSVTLVHRRDALRAGALLQKRAFSNPKMHFVWDSVVTAIDGEKTVQGVRLKNLKTGQDSALKTDGVFVFIGYTPNTELYRGQLEMNPSGYIQTNPLFETSVRGVFAAGEISDPQFRQVVTSAGMGASAAIQAIRYLDEIAVVKE